MWKDDVKKIMFQETKFLLRRMEEESEGNRGTIACFDSAYTYYCQYREVLSLAAMLGIITFKQQTEYADKAYKTMQDIKYKKIIGE